MVRLYLRGAAAHRHASVRHPGGAGVLVTVAKAVCPLDLDHVGAHIGEEAGGERPRDDGGHVEHLDCGGRGGEVGAQQGWETVRMFCKKKNAGGAGAHRLPAGPPHRRRTRTPTTAGQVAP